MPHELSTIKSILARSHYIVITDRVHAFTPTDLCRTCFYTEDYQSHMLSHNHKGKNSVINKVNTTTKLQIHEKKSKSTTLALGSHVNRTGARNHSQRLDIHCTVIEMEINTARIYYSYAPDSDTLEYNLLVYATIDVFFVYNDHPIILFLREQKLDYKTIINPKHLYLKSSAHQKNKSIRVLF